MSNLPNEIASNITNFALEHYGRQLFDQDGNGQLPRQVDIPPGMKPSVYIHIPFCHPPLCQMCPFCKQDFHRPIAGRYMDDLTKELKLQPEIHGSESAYIGGGTPATVLPRLMEVVKEFRLGERELSVEAHPLDLTEEHLTLMQQSGVTRLSVGVQSFNQQVLDLMGRNNGPNPIDNIKQAQSAGITVNADLIYNFSGQTIEQFRDDLAILLELDVAQITCYPLMPTPGMFEKVDTSQEDQFYDAMLEQMGQRGYEPLSPWCFTNDVANNQGEYISNESGHNYAGFGASSISKIGSLFTINTFDLDDYHRAATKNQRPFVASKELNSIEEIQYDLLTQLFSTKLDLSTVSGSHLRDSFVKAQVQLLSAMGLIEIDENIATLTPDGLKYFSRAMKSFYSGLNFFRDKYKT